MLPSSIPLELRDRVPVQPSTLATCIVGANTAGLLFGLFAGIWRQQLGGDLGAWPIVLLSNPMTDRASTRVRVDMRPFEAMRDELDDSLFDELLAFLAEHDHRPRTDELDAMLEDLVARLGIRPQPIPADQNEELSSALAVRRLLDRTGLSISDMALSVVVTDPTSPLALTVTASDGSTPKSGTMPWGAEPDAVLVRLRVEVAPGGALPKRLHPVRHRALAKLHGSVFDYDRLTDRLAEVDLFLPDTEAATVAAAVANAEAAAHGAPLLSAVVDQLSNRLCRESVSVTIDHVAAQPIRWADRMARASSAPTSGAGPAVDGVFLLGEPAWSLPFFRDMAALVLCVESLATIQVGLAATGNAADDLALAVDAYDAEVASIREVELETIERRAAGLEASAATAATMALFPLPTPASVLTQPRRAELVEPMTPRSFGTSLAIAAATLLVVVTPFVGPIGMLSLPVQAMAGTHHRLHLDETRRPNRVVAAMCWVQMLVLVVVGAIAVVGNPFGSGLPLRIATAASSLVLPTVFGLAMVAIARQTSATQNESDRAMTRPEASNTAEAAPRLRPSQPPSQRPSQATTT